MTRMHTLTSTHSPPPTHLHPLTSTHSPPPTHLHPLTSTHSPPPTHFHPLTSTHSPPPTLSNQYFHILRYPNYTTPDSAQAANLQQNRKYLWKTVQVLQEIELMVNRTKGTSFTRDRANGEPYEGNKCYKR